MNIDPQQLAEEWIAAWNAHDLDRVLAHYRDDIELTTPMIRLALGIETGTLRGKTAVREYWATGLQRFPELAFELIAATASIDSIAIVYRAVLGLTAVEVLFFDDTDMVERAVVHYSARPAPPDSAPQPDATR
jgi:hypothetical protein